MDKNIPITEEEINEIIKEKEGKEKESSISSIEINGNESKESFNKNTLPNEEKNKTKKRNNIPRSLNNRTYSENIYGKENFLLKREVNKRTRENISSVLAKQNKDDQIKVLNNYVYGTGRILSQNHTEILNNENELGVVLSENNPINKNANLPPKKDYKVLNENQK